MNSPAGVLVTAHLGDPTAGQRRPRPYDDEVEGTNKRQRTALACDSCRHRKSRCDGARPACASCAGMGFTCVYRRPISAPAYEPSLYSQMESRLHAVESMLQQVTRENPAHPPLQNESAERLKKIGYRADGQDHSQTGMNGVGFSEDTVDGMGTITFAGEAVSHFFGLSSNSAFVARIMRALKSEHRSVNNPLEKQPASGGDLSATLSRPASPPLPSDRQSPKTLNPYLLPPHAEILLLVNSFFDTTGHFFPYIDKNAMIESIEELNSNDVLTVRQSWLCLLNAIMACGTSLTLTVSRDIKADEVRSNVFFERAMAISPWFMSNTANLETVQGLAVMTQYSEGTSRSAQTWRLHGHLVQAALQMGLHFEDAASNIAPLEREIRRRTWYMCVTLDRMLSSTFGRPPLVLPDEFAQVPLPTEVDLENQGLRTAGFSRSMGHDSAYCDLFVETIKLHRIFYDIIRELYNQNLGRNFRPTMEELLISVVRFDQRLHDWEHQLGSGQKLVRFAEVSETTQELQYSRPQIVLTLRYLSVRIMLHRVVLTEYLERVAEGFHTDQPESFNILGQGYISLCSESAREIIDLITHYRGVQGMLPSWWFVLYYVFHAALIIFGVVVVSNSGICPNVPLAYDLVSRLHRSVATVDQIAKQTRLARRCSKYLNGIIHASSAITRNQHTPSQTTFLPNGGVVNAPGNLSLGAPSEENNFSPFDADFGQFVVGDGNLEFLNILSNVTESGPNWG